MKKLLLLFFCCLFSQLYSQSEIKSNPAKQNNRVVTTIDECTFSNGVRISPCKIAYRTYGRLNPQKDNVVLIPTWLLGRSEDWGANGLLGPRGIVDTTKFYTVIVDALGNGHSQSPSNTEVSLKRGFDALTIGDMVKSQHKLLTERLGITHLHAVVGASMGGMQAYEWAVRYPGFTHCIVPIIGSPRIAAFDYLLWSNLHSIIGDGLRGQIPDRDIWLQLARIEMLFSRTPLAVNQVSPDSIAREVATFAENYKNNWKLEDYRVQLGAMTRHDVSADFGGDLKEAATRVQSKALLVYSWDDHMVTAGEGNAFGKLIKTEMLEVPSICGHLMFFCELEKVGAAVRNFLDL